MIWVILHQIGINHIEQHVASCQTIFKCTGSGLVVLHSSHEQEFNGSIPAGCTKTFSPHYRCHLTDCMTSDDVWRHLSYPQKSALHSTRHHSKDNSSTRPHGERKRTALPLQSTGEERKEETKKYSLGETIVSCICNIQKIILVSCLAVTTNEKLPDK
jgi:hypothetical protein